MTEITATTPTSDLLRSRARLLRLAQIVFDRSSPGEAPAFTQFPTNQAIADIIDAKREGVFDYGSHIEHTDAGFQWPPADEVLEMLEAAKSGGAPVEKKPDLKVVTNEVDGPNWNGIAYEDITEDNYGSMSRGEKMSYTRWKNKQAKAEPAPEPTHVEGQGDEQPAMIVPEGVIVDMKPVLKSIDELSKNLGGAFGALQKELQEDHRALASIVANLARGIQVLAARQQQIGEYLDPYVELVPLDGELFEPGPAPEAESQEEDVVEEVTTSPVEEPQEAPVEEPSSANTNGEGSYIVLDSGTKIPTNENGELVFDSKGDFVSLTDDLTMEDCQDLGERVGVPDARNKGYKPGLVHSIWMHIK